MSGRVLIKVYGHIQPVSDDFFTALVKICSDAISDGQDGSILRREEETVRISFEGLYFPLEETLHLLARHIGPEHRGKLDVLDIENWRLSRHVFDGGLRSSSAGLNSVMDYAGL
ncbi:MAG: hypothetical protein LBC94_01235 [Desulfovibrio sp.]|nr:hypothetical protein [Desulfovibrio sp.]